MTKQIKSSAATPRMNQPTVQTGPEFNKTAEVAEQNKETRTAFPWAKLFQSDESKLLYPEAPITSSDERVPLVLDNTNLVLKKELVTQLSGDEFTLIRRDGFGGSDSSILLGVNPYTSKQELLQQKARRTLSEEEKLTGEQVAVMKGNDLEPLIIHKFEKIFNMRTLKPTDMYAFKDWPYLTMNFDGITGSPAQYFPVEIKVVTKRGEKHYDPTKAVYVEREGLRALPENYSTTNNSWETKAALYGVPPYYYTQLQQEIFAANAPFGFLATLWESTWKVVVYFIYADPICHHALIIEGFKAWQYVEKLRKERGLPEKFVL